MASSKTETDQEYLKRQVVACMAEIRRYWELADRGRDWLTDDDLMAFEGLALSIEYRTTGWASRDDIQADEARVVLVCGGPHVEVWYAISQSHGYSTPDDARIFGEWWGDEYLLALSAEDYEALEWAFEIWAVNPE
jgi:hypothetical protein